ncbi:DinB family protein [Candidatus Binatia bacterium]|nr:DinB family protein [Candidatus Binatia bacterium]
MSETQRAAAELNDATDRFVRTVSVGPEQWRYAPSGGWSLSRITEHVAISCDNIAQLLRSHLASRPIERGATGVLDVEIPYLFYRGDEPPSVATPTGTWTDPDDAVARLVASADAIIVWSRATKLGLRSFGVRHPVFGVLDGVQWLLFAAAHLERHRAQALGVKSLADLPG